MGKVTTLSLDQLKKNSPASCLKNSVRDDVVQISSLNALCNSLIKLGNRKKFRAFPDGYCRQFGLTLEEIHAVTDLDVVQLLKLGGSIPALERLISVYGLEIIELCAEQTGKSLDEVQQFLDSF